MSMSLCGCVHVSTVPTEARRGRWVSLEPESQSDGGARNSTNITHDANHWEMLTSLQSWWSAFNCLGNHDYSTPKSANHSSLSMVDMDSCFNRQKKPPEFLCSYLIKLLGLSLCVAHEEIRWETSTHFPIICLYLPICLLSTCGFFPVNF